MTDLASFRKAVVGLDFQEDVVPANCTLLLSLIETFVGSRSLADSRSYLPDERLNYFGQLHFRDGQIASELRTVYLTLDERDYAQTKLMQNSLDGSFKNLLLSEEFGSHESLDDVSARVKIQVQEA